MRPERRPEQPRSLRLGARRVAARAAVEAHLAVDVAHAVELAHAARTARARALQPAGQVLPVDVRLLRVRVS